MTGGFHTFPITNYFNPDPQTLRKLGLSLTEDLVTCRQHLVLPRLSVILHFVMVGFGNLRRPIC